MLKIGHRGASGYAPENTLKSFQLAIDMGVDGIELDIQRCASGELVVFHDDTLQRLTGAPGYIEETTLANLRKLRVKGAEPIPTLEETLRFIDQRVTLFIEIKSEEAGSIAGAFMESFVASGLRYADFYLISFNHVILKRIRAVHPRIKTGAIIVSLPASLAAFGQECGATSINPAIAYITPELVEDARQRKLEIFAWTCNSARDIARAKALGVDGIMGDYPDRL